MTSLLILTVGTGTSGTHSNLAQGLINTVQQLAPRKFWLVPSTSPDSITLAELVRESAPAGSAFQPWTADQPFRQIEQHDDLFICRAALREAIHAARQCLRQGERLIVNPTSGTKQMSVAATLAALDEEVGDIVFTVGERADGVVKTGTERMAPFSTRRFFLERDLAMAGELFDAGSFWAAAQLLKQYTEAEAMQARERALCLREWQRLHYGAAACHAARFDQQLHDHLARLASSDPLTIEILGDHLVGADALRRWNDFEEALARFYRSAELTAKVRLALNFDLRPPYSVPQLSQCLAPSSLLMNDVRSRARDGELYVGYDLAWRLLEAMGDRLATAWRSDRQLQQALQRRNEGIYGHGSQPADVSVVDRVVARMRNLFGDHFSAVLDCWNMDRRPRSLT